MKILKHIVVPDSHRCRTSDSISPTGGAVAPLLPPDDPEAWYAPDVRSTTIHWSEAESPVVTVSLPTDAERTPHSGESLSVNDHLGTPLQVER
jgi:hypothetical protein